MKTERTEPEPLGRRLETRVREIVASHRDQGRFENTAQPVDWTGEDGRRRIDWLLRISGVPEEYRHPDLDKCRVREDVRAYAATVDARMRRGQGITLFGPTGTGKSSTASLLAAAALKQKFTVRWDYVPDLTDSLLDSRRRQDVRNQQSAADLLIWDDFGVRPLSDFEIGLLDQVVERRYRRRKAMVIAMNQSQKDVSGDPRLARMWDRWQQRNRLLVIGGRSMRTFGT